MKTRHLLLELDLATENNVPAELVKEHLPANAEVWHYRMTQFGAERLPEASRRAGWHLWRRCFDAMLREARRESPSEQFLLHYHVFGRMPMPLATYVGLALSSSVPKLTVYNPRKGTSEFDVFDLEKPRYEPPGPPFFTTERTTSGGMPADGVLALCVGAGQSFAGGVVEDFLREQGAVPCAIVELNADPKEQPVLDASSAPAALRQIRRRLDELPGEFPCRRGTAVFCAGPITLGIAVGWAAANFMRPVWLPNHEKSAAPAGYRSALNFPKEGARRARPRILILTADPRDEARVDVDRELTAIERGLEPVKGRYELKIHHDFQGRDLATLLKEWAPDIVHVLCHGTDKSGLVAIRPGGTRAAEIIAAEVVKAFGYAEPPPRLVVLHACYSRKTAGMLAERVDVAFGTSDSIAQETAAHFAWEFYDGLAAGHSVCDAYERAKLHLQMSVVRDEKVIGMEVCPDGDEGAWVPFPRATPGRSEPF